MTGNVILKSSQNGIRVLLSEEVDFEQIVKETKQSFQDASGFFQDASVVISFQGRRLTEEETDELYHAIISACNLHIICLVCTDEGENDYYTKVIQGVRALESEPDQTCQFYKGTLRDGELFESAASVVVLGDILEGAAVIARGNIIVLGGLYGTAYAGVDGSRNRFIAALSLEAEHLRIGDVKYKKEWKDKLSIKKKQNPRMAVISKDKMIIRDLDFTKELPENNLL
ncbi:MAG: septum site-determining protein MinC [Lachnospiraceae bacterium]|nr:septum site-determining protein MinC [Lachnospiraceae bacterium]